MRQELKRRAIISVIIVLVCLVLVLWPRPVDAQNRPRPWSERFKDFVSWTDIKQNVANNIRLGLDLKGGTHLVMQVQWQDAVNAKVGRNIQQSRLILQRENIPFTDIQQTGLGEITVTVPDAGRNDEIVEKLLPDFNQHTLTGTGWERLSQSNNSIILQMTEQEVRSVADKATADAYGVVDTRINALGVAEPSIQFGAEGSHQIVLQLPGVDNPDRVKKLLRTESRLELGLLIGTHPTKEAAEAAKAGNPNQAVLAYKERGQGESWAVIQTPPVVTGEDLRDAQALPSRAGTDVYEITFSLTSVGADKFYQFTSTNIGQRLAIILNNEVRSAPTVQGAIRDRGEITGGFSREDAEDLALTLRSGALPAKIVYLEERTVGPSLGADSIRQGVFSSLAGLIAIAIFMVIYYRGSGINAIVALIINLIILMAGMVTIGAVLTLPGIAGVVLTIGMAVDSNILIFERIREELRHGKTVPSAVDSGFNRVLITIIDTHVTTIVAALLLFLFGTGPIRGFAITLVIGLLANVFASVYVSRTMFKWVLSRQGARAESLSI